MKENLLLSDTSARARIVRLLFHGTQSLCAMALLIATFGPIEYTRPAAAFTLTIGLITIAFSVVIGLNADAQLARRKKMVDDAHEANRQIQELFAMTDMLQSAEGHDDAGTVLMTTAMRLLPGFNGALYIFNNSRDRLDLARSWNTSPGFRPSETLLPSNCWALKRGKPHINDPHSHTLCCLHHLDETATVEVPMMARGSVYGLLVLGIEAEDAFDRLMEVRRLGRALADSMSLAISNITLREKLRTQSLRDPLTGLYNRRYMEDALERYVSLAERTGSPTSVLMIDLDNFKKVNDEHGHAKGDAVLRDVATQLVAGLRPSDVVARYGGEELMVILPGCPLDDARHKAENLRERIEGLADAHGVAISASFGVACVPETSSSPADVVPMADGALYVAKQAGKNCVRVAQRRADRGDDQLRLAVG